MSNGIGGLRRSFLVVGAGPVGGIFGCHMAAAGHEVTVADPWREHAEAIRSSGIVLDDYKSLHGLPSRVVGSVAEASGESFDYVVVAVKTPHMPAVAASMKDLPGGYVVVSLQNGLDNEEYLAESCPAETVLRVAVNYAGNIAAPGSIHMTFFNKPNYVGCLCGEYECQHARELADLMTAAHLETKVSPDIKRHTWKKTILNAALGPVSAVMGMTMAEAMGCGDTARVVEDLLKECIDVARAAGYTYGDNFFEFCIDYLSRGGHHKPSMLVDLEKGRPTEIDFVNGKVVWYGNQLGVPTPINRTFVALIRAMESGRMGS